MAPEMYVRPLRYTAAVDLWCVGCVAYELTSPSKFIFVRVEACSRTSCRLAPRCSSKAHVQQMHQYLQPGFALQTRGAEPERVAELATVEKEKHMKMRSYMRTVRQQWRAISI